jgi:hypothetical protein
MDWLAYIIWSLVLVVGNVLDSVSTHLALNKLPENLRATESNPIMNGFFKRHKVILATVIKHAVILGIILYYSLVTPLLYSVQLCAILIWLVVFNNLYILFGRLLTKRKIKSPMHKLISLIHIPEKFHFAVIIVVLMGLSLGIMWLIYGGIV